MKSERNLSFCRYLSPPYAQLWALYLYYHILKMKRGIKYDPSYTCKYV